MTHTITPLPWATVADCFCDTGPEDDTEIKANAILIAQTPELLRNLKAVLERYLDLVNSGDCGNWDPEDERIVIDARAVIAKATAFPC